MIWILMLLLTPAVENLRDFVRETGAAMLKDPAAARRALSSKAVQLEKQAKIEGEDRVWAGLIFARAHRYRLAAAPLSGYLADGGVERELALAALVEACSWPDTDYELARRTYASYLKEFPDSKTVDPLRGGARLRWSVEESMARVAALDREDNESAARHYGRAIAEAQAGPPEVFPTAELFRLRWYRADALASAGHLQEALAYLYETRPLVQGDARSALDLEDRILFRETDKRMDERKYAEAKEVLERRLPEFASVDVLHRRVSKLLDRVKLVDSPAPAFADGAWIGGGPYSMDSLRGHVVLLEFLTSG